MQAEMMLDDESIPVHVRKMECKRLLNKAISEAKRRGFEMDMAEAHYYSEKAEEAFKLLEAGYANTFIQTVIKGRPSVVEAMRAYHDAEVEYKNANEAINAYKLVLKTLEADEEREWEQARRMV